LTVIRKALLALAAAVALAAPAATAATPIDVTGERNGAPYRIVVPANWNGTLVVHAHGYRDAADQPGEVDDRSAPAAPVAALEPALLGMGYALAGSAYQANGWAVKEGIADTRSLVSTFRELVGQPSRTLLWGFSMGSLVTLALAEQTAGHFDGYLAACAVAAGASRAWDGAGATSLAYSAAFGWPASWGTIGDVRDDVDFEADVLPKMIPEVSNPLNFGKFEFIRLVTGAAPLGFPAPGYPGWILTNMFFGLEARAELERRAGGPVVQNLSHVYTLSAADKAYLAVFGVNADALLATMNAGRTIAPVPSSRNYVEQWADFSGKVKQPVLTLHTQTDSLVPPSHESAYAATVAAAGRGDLLAQTFTTGNGHCNFTGPQLVTALTALDQWVATGQKPGPVAFPAALGFIPGFAAPPWPQQ
jgi:pimeloyl-ACP methyl ester carboxylesterase